MLSGKKNKRILIVCQHFWPESFRINDVSDFLSNDKDCEVEVLCGLPNYPSGKFSEGYSIFGPYNETRNGIKIMRTLEIPRGNNSNLRIFLNYISFPFFSLFHLPRLLFRKYDHIVLYQTSPVMMSLVGILLSKMKRIPSTMYVLDLWPENLFSVLPIKNRFAVGLITNHSHWYYRKADQLVALSERMKEQLLQITGKADDRVIVLPQACESIYEKDVVNKQLVMRFKDTFNVVFAGNISPAQSLPTIIAAAEILKNKGYTDIRWVIVGDGMSRKETEAAVVERKLEDVFVFEGMKPMEDIPAYNHIASVLVGCLVKSPLLEATIPAKVMSYIASGKPIVLAMDGEVQDLINKEIRCGFAGTTEDSAALAANIEKIYKMNPKSRVSMGRRGRDYHFAHFERNLVLSKLYRFMFSH